MQALAPTEAAAGSRAARLDPCAKILTAFLFVAACATTPPEAWGAFVAYAALLAAAIALSRVPPWPVLRRAMVVLPFAGMVAIFLPFIGSDDPAGGYSLGFREATVSRSGIAVLRTVLVKSYLSAAAVALLSATTAFPDILRGLERLRVPSTLVMTTGLACRYAFVLADEARRMVRARDSRCYDGRWLWHARAAGFLAGGLFLRSYERGERVYMSMVSRGFDGRAPSPDAPRLRPRDYIFALAAFALIAASRLGGQ